MSGIIPETVHQPIPGGVMSPINAWGSTATTTVYYMLWETGVGILWEAGVEIDWQ